MKRISIDQAIEAHIRCCPYLTSQMGLHMMKERKVKAACGMGHLYCTDNNCFYQRDFRDTLEELLKEAQD